MPRIMFKAKSSGLEAVWDDNLIPFFSKLGELGQIERVSHVDPGAVVDGRPTWIIRWQARFAELFGPLTYCDETGNPFFTKRAAEEFEVKVLENNYFSRPL